MPDDLQRELDARPEAAAFFAGLDSRNRYAILYRLQDAKRPETRARRLAKFVAMLEAGETIHPRRESAPAPELQSPVEALGLLEVRCDHDSGRRASGRA